MSVSLKCDKCGHLEPITGVLVPNGWETDRSHGIRLDMCPECIFKADLKMEEMGRER